MDWKWGERRGWSTCCANVVGCALLGGCWSFKVKDKGRRIRTSPTGGYYPLDLCLYTSRQDRLASRLGCVLTSKKEVRDIRDR